MAPVLAHASGLLGRRIAPASRGGASDASHFAATIPITVDGLGPRGGKAHNPEEFVLEASLQPRAEVALALILSAPYAVGPRPAPRVPSGARARAARPRRGAARTAATPPFLKSTRPPVKS